jgi:hypothetical protein
MNSRPDDMFFKSASAKGTPTQNQIRADFINRITEEKFHESFDAEVQNKLARGENPEKVKKEMLTLKAEFQKFFLPFFAKKYDEFRQKKDAEYRNNQPQGSVIRSG